MAKELKDMTLEELWELFPIVLKEYRPEYKDWYVIEDACISGAVGEEHIVRISHIGSTAVPGLISKPTVDILLEITDDSNLESLKSALIGIGYVFSPQPKNPAPHMMFNKGYTPEGYAEKVFHLHVRYSGDWNELYFRDYLIAHSDIAEQYGKLKLSLQPGFEHNRDGYTEAKTEFIKIHTDKAREEFAGRHTPTTYQ